MGTRDAHNDAERALSNRFHQLKPIRDTKLSLSLRFAHERGGGEAPKGEWAGLPPDI